MSTVFTFIAPLLTDVAGFAAPAVSGLLLAYGAGGFAGNLIAGRLTDRSMCATLRGVFGGLAGVLVLVPFALLWKPSAVLVVLGLGLPATTTIAPLEGLILRHAGAAPTLAVSVNVGAFNLGAAAGSTLGGLIVASGGPRCSASPGRCSASPGSPCPTWPYPRRDGPPRDKGRPGWGALSYVRRAGTRPASSCRSTRSSPTRPAGERG